uniref:Uncharacterized protein n=1 Tax=Timema tahoe TaxID=61484 RepID=A0A7R9IRR3_9NEOP|nr:unnamed protein product [Timema tahoe]
MGINGPQVDHHKQEIDMAEPWSLIVAERDEPWKRGRRRPLKLKIARRHQPVNPCAGGLRRTSLQAGILKFGNAALRPVNNTATCSIADLMMIGTLCLLLLLTAFTTPAYTARILGVAPFPAQSHSILLTSLFKELANRGHHLTVITSLPLKEKKPPNYVEIDTGVTLMSGFAHKFNVPIISVCTFAGFESIGDAVGNPYPYSYVPHALTKLTTHMSFLERLQNTLLNTYANLGHYLYYLPKQNELLVKYFKDTVENLPYVDDLVKRTSLVFLNNHFSYSFPRPYVTNIVEVGGLHIKPAKKLPYSYDTVENLPYVDDLVKRTSLVFLNNHFSYSFPRPYVTNIVEVGGLHIKPAKKLPQDLQKFMDDAKEGVVYFSLGSNLQSSDLPEYKREAFLKAFSKLKQKVLWKFEADILPGQPANVRIQKWLPQSDILEHFSLSYLNNAKRISKIYLDQPKPPMDLAVYWTEYVIRHKGAPHLRSAALDLNWFQLHLLDVTAVLFLILTIVIVGLVFITRTFVRLVTRRTTKNKPQTKSSKKKKMKQTLIS